MIITFRPALPDLIHAARAWEGRHWRVARYAVAVGLLACGSFLLINAERWWGGIFVAFGVLEAFNLLPAAVVRAMIEFHANPKFREEYQLTLTPESLHFCTTTINSTLKWTHYTQFFETQKAFILIYGKRMYTVIPKRALVHDSQLRELRELLSQVFGEASEHE
jgi:hypothetical protein